ncbi:MAG: hypothetical protein ACI4XP_03155 [Acutalibacteraceae bacterium]
MPTVKQVIARNTGAGSAATRYTKSARVSARAFAQSGMLGRTVARRKSLGGKGG